MPGCSASKSTRRRTTGGRSFPYAQVAELAEIVAAQIASAERIGKETDRIVSHLFFEPDGSPITKHHYWEAFKAARTAAGCPSRTLHDFRRTAVRALVRAGVAESVAMKCTGHLTRSVFDRYDISSGADLNDAGGQLNAYRTSTPAADEQPTAKVIEITRAAGRRRR